MPTVWADPSYFLQTAAASPQCEKPVVTVKTGLERGFKIVPSSKQKVFA